LISIIPRKRTRTFDIRRLIELVVDDGSFFEIGGAWGKSIVIGLARLGGRSTGVISQDCREKGGTLDEKSAQKLRRFLDLW
jgi:acetyl-CoA carboxylase carboxyltransferase component